MITTVSATSFAALGTTAILVVSNEQARGRALGVLRGELDAMDLAASRFRPDSELSALNAAAGRPVAASSLFLEAIEAALRAARLTGGLVDPTVGQALQVIGYDRDFAAIAATGPAIRLDVRSVPGWQGVVVDRAASTVRIATGMQLDLGATAKALCADRAARAAAAATGTGVLVSLGGDVSVAGPAPAGGWIVRVTHDHADPPEAEGPTFSVLAGGLATSSTSVRRWERGRTVLHHVIDPSTSTPTVEHWQTVSVAAGSCLDANIASTAAIILGPAAPVWLTARDLPARLVNSDGQVTTVGGWPPDPLCVSTDRHGDRPSC